MAVGEIIPPEFLATRVATGSIIADSATYTTTETGLITATGVLTAGRTYILRAWCRVATGTVTGSEISLMRIRADAAVTGQHLLAGQVFMPTTSTVGFNIALYTEFTASVTGSKSFVLCGLRSSGSGTHRIAASADSPAYLAVDLKVST
jgi:hypothetical protein